MKDDIRIVGLFLPSKDTRITLENATASVPYELVFGASSSKPLPIKAQNLKVDDYVYSITIEFVAFL